ncbi:hypothetical protein MAPG_02171 [Magnaporthiopsis poae ATCC 64411]|uniref:Uncharacterized protein n=1 Tax=Magnaporthiopsis poae (strain ATCC 64411 / 73-15) TaxID=644358 RepID=A0A0C4DQM8_MAGP6|nr:hypothetical protein MAPG_02171 [Magnaporthiopsis poae ATCC 64411]
MFYQVNLVVLAVANAYPLYKQWKTKPREPTPVLLSQRQDRQDPESLARAATVASKFKHDFFVAYALAVAADWLQVSA